MREQPSGHHSSAACGASAAVRSTSITRISARSASRTPWPEADDSASGARFAARLSRAVCSLRVSGVEGVGLGQGDDLGLVREAVRRRPRARGARSCRRRPACSLVPSTRCSSTPAALDMAEETVAEARALMRALDQAGNVGEHELAPVDAHDAEAGMQRGERDSRRSSASPPRRRRGRSTCRRSAGRRGRRRRSA